MKCSAPFQLSFGIVAGILLLTRPLRDLLFGRWLALRGLLVFRREERRRRWLWRTGLNWMAATVSISIAAWLAGLPLAAFHFQRITPAGAIMTLALLPLVAGLLGVALAQLVCAIIAPNLGALLASSLAGFSDHIVDLTLATHRLSWLSIEVRPVSAWAAAIMCVLLVAAPYVLRLRSRRPLALSLLVVGFAAPMIVTQLPAGTARHAELAVLDVGHGQCAAFRAPDGRVFLFDAGSRSQADPFGQTLQPFLQYRRWPWPTAAFVSHGDADHYNAVGALIETHPPRTILTNDEFGQGDEEKRLVRRFLERAAEKNVNLRRLRAARRSPFRPDAM